MYVITLLYLLAHHIEALAQRTGIHVVKFEYGNSDHMYVGQFEADIKSKISTAKNFSAPACVILDRIDEMFSTADTKGQTLSMFSQEIKALDGSQVLVVGVTQSANLVDATLLHLAPPPIYFAQMSDAVGEALVKHYLRLCIIKYSTLASSIAAPCCDWSSSDIVRYLSSLCTHLSEKSAACQLITAQDVPPIFEEYKQNFERTQAANGLMVQAPDIISRVNTIDMQNRERAFPLHLQHELKAIYFRLKQSQLFGSTFKNLLLAGPAGIG